MAKKTGANKENFEQTSKIFLDIARKEFIEYGYGNASTERIVEQSGMARGSLYYHYGNKEGIFRAVYMKVIKEFANRIHAHIEDEEDAVMALKKGCRFFFEQCKRPDVRIILLTEGLAVIPYLERMKILEQDLMALLRRLILNIQSQGKIKDYDTHVLIVFVYGMLAESGRSLEFVTDVGAFIDMYSENMDRLLDKLTENK